MTARQCTVTFGAMLLATVASAQSTTGRLIGSVMDKDGAPVHGATVSIQAPVLIGGSQAKTTGVEGGFSFLGLHPGQYEVTVEFPGYISRELIEKPSDQSGLAGTDLTSQLDETAAAGHTVDQMRQGLRVLFA